MSECYSVPSNHISFNYYLYLVIVLLSLSALVFKGLVELHDGL